jgi:hypothetical protein
VKQHPGLGHGQDDDASGCVGWLAEGELDLLFAGLDLD